VDNKTALLKDILMFGHFTNMLLSTNSGIVCIIGFYQFLLYALFTFHSFYIIFICHFLLSITHLLNNCP